MSFSMDITSALTPAIEFLTRPLIGRFSQSTIELLHFTLARNLSKHYENNWFPAEPARGSGRRCITLIPGGSAPRPIHFACKSARVEWKDWMPLLSKVEMDMFIDPGRVSVRISGVNHVYNVWTAPKEVEENSIENMITADLIEDDDEEIFKMIADEIRAPTWMSPILSQFPSVPRAPPSSVLGKLVIPNHTKVSKNGSTDSNLLSVGSGHSRSSSFSSISDASGFSFSSVDSASTPASSFYSPAKKSAVSSKSSSPFSARPRSAGPKDVSVLLPASSLIMQATADEVPSEVPTCVVVDSTKKEVTPYDGGKTTVLTGGVMLGMKNPVPQTPRNPTTPRAFVPMAVRRNVHWRNNVTVWA